MKKWKSNAFLEKAANEARKNPDWWRE